VIAKLIECRVPETQRAAFDAAQRGWSVLAAERGFVMQIGGWDARSSDVAIILGLWKSVAAYDVFMSGPHDAVAGRQTATYERIDVTVLPLSLEMPGLANDVISALRDAALLRVARCELIPGRSRHFDRVQQLHWASVMEEAGMLGGAMWRSGDVAIVTTGWPSVDVHERYAREVLPEAREEAEVERDVAETRGYGVRTEATWRVVVEE